MWGKVDDGFLEHPKTIAAADVLAGDRTGKPESVALAMSRRALGRVAAVWLEGNLYASRRLNGGFVPRAVVERFQTDEKPLQVADALVRGGLWLAIDGGFQFHDWGQWNPDAEKKKEQREKDRLRKQQERARDRAPREAINHVRSEPVTPPVLLLSERTDDGHNADGVRTCPAVIDLVQTLSVWSPDASRARDPVPVPVPVQTEQESSEPLARHALPAPGASRTAPMLRVRLSVWEVRPHLLAAVHALIASGAPYLDADGQPVPGELLEALKTIAARDLQAEWEGRELQAILDAALGRRASLLEADIAAEGFRRRERRQVAGLSARRWQRGAR